MYVHIHIHTRGCTHARTHARSSRKGGWGSRVMIAWGGGRGTCPSSHLFQLGTRVQVYSPARTSGGDSSSCCCTTMIQRHASRQSYTEIGKIITYNVDVSRDEENVLNHLALGRFHMEPLLLLCEENTSTDSSSFSPSPFSSIHGRKRLLQY